MTSVTSKELTLVLGGRDADLRRGAGIRSLELSGGHDADEPLAISRDVD